MSLTVQLASIIGSGYNVRKDTVVQDFIFEVAKLLDNLLSLSLLLGIVGLGNSAVDVVNSTSLCIVWSESHGC